LNSYPPVTVIILTYNSAAIIERCLRSFAALSYANATLLVVDNNSSDGTAALVEKNFPHVELLQTGENEGYAGGNNRGFEVALRAGAEYVLVVNPDTTLFNPDFLTQMVAHLETHRQIGIAGPKVFFREAGIIQNTILFPPGLAKNIVHWVRYRMNNRFAQLSGDTEMSAEMLNGVCVLLRAECLRQIGFFDEAIFMYIEDADLAYRARAAGWQIKYLPIESVIHEQKAEGYDETSFVAWLLKRNSVYYLVKVGKYFDAIGYALLSVTLFSLKWIAKGFPREYARFIWKLIVGYYVIFTGQASGRRLVK
jgi:N-acetylglucosaminyl-diphospho-decaprenol L-rhamnosyltransferase